MKDPQIMIELLSAKIRFFLGELENHERKANRGENPTGHRSAAKICDEEIQKARRELKDWVRELNKVKN